MTDGQNRERKVDVVEHDKSWKPMFELESERLQHLFGDLVINIHHVGSTAVPGIYAKPIIDILIEVKSIGEVDQYNPGMRQLGYLPKGEFGISGRRFFIKGTEVDRTHHVHIYEVGDVEVGRHVNFRDYLKLHPDAAMEYSNLKQMLSKQYPYDIDAYMFEKSSFISELEIKINIWKKFIEKDLF